MKSEKLKSLLAQKTQLAQQQTTDVSVLNQEQLIYAMGGSAAEGCDCPMLQSCGKYCNCGAKIGSAS